MPNPYVEEIKKLQSQIDRMREELAIAVKASLPANSLAVSFIQLMVASEHPELIKPTALAALLFNSGCRVNENHEWVTPTGETIKGYREFDKLTTERIPNPE